MKRLSVLVAVFLFGFMMIPVASAQTVPQEVTAFEAEKNRDGVLLLVAAVQHTDDEDMVTEFMDEVDLEEKADELVAQFDGVEILEGDEEKGPKAGDDSLAYAMLTATRNGSETEVVIVYVQEGADLYIYVAYGLTDLYDEVIDIVEEFHEDDPDGELMELTDMPDGFILLDVDDGENI